jgi:flagellar hook assembly protein FlgD
VFDLSRAAKVSVVAYDVRGRAVAEIFKGVLPQGQNAITWNGRTDSGEELPSGIYFFRFKSGNFEITRKAMLVR